MVVFELRGLKISSVENCIHDLGAELDRDHDATVLLPLAIQDSADLSAARKKLKAAFDAENGSSPHTETGITHSDIPSIPQLIKGGITHSGIPSIAQLLGAGITPEIAKWAKAIEHQRS